jgi:outer membrane protein assembly factor BamB
MVVVGVSSADAQPSRLGARADEASVRIVALDPRWTASFDTVPAAPSGFDQQMAYIPLKGGQLVAVDLSTGAVAWTRELATTFTPATGDGLVFAATDGAVTAFEQRRGEQAWSTPIGGAIAAPLYWDSGSLLLSTSSGDLMSLDAQDGRVRWRQPLGSRITVAPAPAGDRVFVALDDGRLASLDLAGGAIIWTVVLNEPVTGLLALSDQLIVGTRANRLHSVSTARGRIRWTQRAGADVAGAAAADDGAIYFAALDNVLRAVSRRSGNLRWTRRLASRPSSGPLRTGNLVLLPFVTTDIGAFAADTGVETFTIRAVGELAGVPFLRDGARPTAPLLVAMSREGALQAFASRVEPPPAPLPGLPGVRVGG